MPSDPLEQLRLALREAAADQFAGVLSDGLGSRLREPTDQLLATGVGPQERELRHFRGGLDRFDERGRQDRSRIVAHGLRICMSLIATRADTAEAAQPRPRRRKQDLGRRLGRSSAAAKQAGTTQADVPVSEATRNFCAPCGNCKRRASISAWKYNTKSTVRTSAVPSTNSAWSGSFATSWTTRLPSALIR